MVSMRSAPSPVLRKTTIRGSLSVPVPCFENPTRVGDALIFGAGAVPRPLTAIERPPALSTISMIAVRSPAAVGENPIAISHTPDFSIGAPHVFDIRKSLGCSPRRVTVRTCSRPNPELLRVTTLGSLTSPTACLVNFTDVGDTRGVGPTALAMIGIRLVPALVTTVRFVCRSPATSGVNESSIKHVSPGSSSSLQDHSIP